MRTLGVFLTSKAARFVVAGVVVVAAVVVGMKATRGTPTYPINVVYSNAPGLFTGAAVDILGVKVGTVTNVQNVGDKVDVSLAVNQGTRIPSAAFASLVASQLLGSPDVDLNPGYTGGPTLSPGATIPEDHTAVPVSTDELLKELQHTLNAINPNAVGNLVTNLATDLDGQGANLNKLIASAAGTVQLLANKGDDLGKLNGTLAQLTGTLDTDTNQIEQLVEQYDTVSTTVAQHSGQLNDAITQLAGASSGLVSLLTPNLQPLEADVGTVTTVGRTLDRNLSSVDAILQNGNNLFQGAQRGVRPQLQLAGPEPCRQSRRVRGLHRGPAAGPPGGNLPAHRGQPRQWAFGVRARHIEPVRKPLIGFLRPAAQRHPDDPEHLERKQQLCDGAVAAATGSHPDRQRRSRRTGRSAHTVDPVATEGTRHEHDDHNDHCAQTDDDDHHVMRTPRCRPRLPRGLEHRFRLGGLEQFGILGFGILGFGVLGFGSRRAALEPCCA